MWKLMGHQFIVFHPVSLLFIDPHTCAQVDPIVASFCGGAVGVLSTLLVVEVNNKDRQAAQRCVYCEVRLVAIMRT